MIGKFENNLIQLNELQEIQDGVHRFDALEDDQVMVTTENTKRLKKEKLFLFRLEEKYLLWMIYHNSFKN